MKNIDRFMLYMLFLLSTAYTNAQVSVLTQHNDLSRTGRNTNETILTTANVNASTFGKVFTRSVDDQIYAQPLIVSGLKIQNGTHNVVFVATVNNSVYAYDADDPSASKPYWMSNFTPSGTVVVKNTDMQGACGGNYQDFSGHIGIVGTPVIDTATNTMFFVSRDKTVTAGDSGTFEQWLHAIDIRTGKDVGNSPQLITGTYQGNGNGSKNGTILFNPKKQNQRPALALVKGIIYIEWSSHCDWDPYHGWMIGYDENTLQPKYTWMDTPDGSEGGIWMSGQAISADDDGNLYIVTGNGTVGLNGNPKDTINRGESILRMQPQGSTLSVKDFFTPHDFDKLEEFDLDFGSSGLLLIPGTKWGFTGGKEGTLYLVDLKNLGGVHKNNDKVIQSFSIGSGNEIHNGAVYLNTKAAGPYVYVWPASTYMYGYRVDKQLGMLDYPPNQQSGMTAPSGQPGGMLSVSSNGDQNGIVWAAHQLVGDANQQTEPGILRAFDATDISTELWDSQIMASRDSVGEFAKFVNPTIANGKVYLATFSNQLDVYGLLQDARFGSTNHLNFDVFVSPNPAKGLISFKVSDPQITISRIEMVDEYGKVVLNNSAVTNQQIDVSQFTPGTYFVKFYSDNGLIVKKVSVAK